MKPKRPLIVQREPRPCSKTGFASWLLRQKIPDAQKIALLNQWQKNGPQLKQAQEAGPWGLLDIFEDIRELLEWLKNYIAWLASTPYVFSVSNETGYPFSDVVWAYELGDGSVLMQAVYNIADGSIATMQHSSCLSMRQYAFAIYMDGEEVLRSNTMTVGDINNMEAQAFGAINMCEDLWHITPA